VNALLDREYMRYMAMVNAMRARAAVPPTVPPNHPRQTQPGQGGTQQRIDSGVSPISSMAAYEEARDEAAAAMRRAIALHARLPQYAFPRLPRVPEPTAALAPSVRTSPPRAAPLRTTASQEMPPQQPAPPTRAPLPAVSALLGTNPSHAAVPPRPAISTTPPSHESRCTVLQAAEALAAVGSHKKQREEEEASVKRRTAERPKSGNGSEKGGDNGSEKGGDNGSDNGEHGATNGVNENNDDSDGDEDIEAEELDEIDEVDDNSEDDGMIDEQEDGGDESCSGESSNSKLKRRSGGGSGAREPLGHRAGASAGASGTAAVSGTTAAAKSSEVPADRPRSHKAKSAVLRRETEAHRASPIGGGVEHRASKTAGQFTTRRAGGGRKRKVAPRVISAKVDSAPAPPDPRTIQPYIPRAYDVIAVLARYCPFPVWLQGEKKPLAYVVEWSNSPRVSPRFAAPWFSGVVSSGGLIAYLSEEQPGIVPHAKSRKPKVMGEQLCAILETRDWTGARRRWIECVPAEVSQHGDMRAFAGMRRDPAMPLAPAEAISIDAEMYRLRRRRERNPLFRPRRDQDGDVARPPSLHEDAETSERPDDSHLPADLHSQMHGMPPQVQMTEEQPAALSPAHRAADVPSLPPDAVDIHATPPRRARASPSADSGARRSQALHARTLAAGPSPSASTAAVSTLDGRLPRWSYAVEPPPPPAPRPALGLENAPGNRRDPGSVVDARGGSVLSDLLHTMSGRQPESGAIVVRAVFETIRDGRTYSRMDDVPAGEQFRIYYIRPR